MVLAPLAVLPLGPSRRSSGSSATWLDLPPLAAAYVVLLALALGTRALHWDGLADTADGLTASYTPARSLEVMRPDRSARPVSSRSCWWPGSRPPRSCP